VVEIKEEKKRTWLEQCDFIAVCVFMCTKEKIRDKKLKIKRKVVCCCCRDFMNNRTFTYDYIDFK